MSERLVTRKRRIIYAIVLLVVVLPLTGWMFLYASACYYRSKAEYACTALKQIRPGRTSVADAKTSLILAGLQLRDVDSQTIQLGVINEPEWVGRLFRWLWYPGEPNPLDRWLVRPSMLMAYLEYSDGEIRVLTIYDWSEDGHPSGAIVRQYAGSRDKLPAYTGGAAFDGYSVRNHWVNQNGVPRNVIVDLDDRATAEQRSSALKFSFTCFTRFKPCDDGRLMLNLPANGEDF